MLINLVPWELHPEYQTAPEIPDGYTYMSMKDIMDFLNMYDGCAFE